MGIKEQFGKLKENWLLIVLILVVAAFLNVGSVSQTFNKSGFGGVMTESAAMDSSYYGGTAYSRNAGIMPYPTDFAPEEQNRKITKTASLSTEVETGTFRDADSMVKSVVKSTGSYLLNENSNKYDSGWKEYYSGYYQIKVDSRKYSDVITQLKAIGEVKSFSETSDDITASFKNIQTELNAEKERLARYQKMYGEATLVADKIQLSDMMFNQERTIKYMEDSLKNVNLQVDYSTIYLTINEKQSEYSNTVFVKLSELVKSFVESINSLLKLLFTVVPWAIAGFIAWIAIRFFRKKKK